MNKSLFILKHAVTRLLSVLVLVFVIMFVNLSIAQQQTTQGKVRLATGEGYYPFVDNKLPDGGWSTSLINLAFKKINMDTSIEILPWNRALKWTQEGRYLAAFPFVYSEQRAENFLFSTAINFVPVHMFVASGSKFTSPDQLQNKRLCFPFSYSLDSIEQGIVDKYQMHINRVKDGIGCVKHVQKGWSDAGLTNSYIDANRLPRNKVEEMSIVIFPEQLAFIPLYLVIGKNHPKAKKWLTEFNNAFDLLKKSGEKSAVDSRYLDLISTP